MSTVVGAACAGPISVTRPVAPARRRVLSVAADGAELVVDAIKKMTLPPKAIDEPRAELARRLRVPGADLVGSKRRRLETRLASLPKLYSWGDLTDEAYRQQMAETRPMLAELPVPNKLLAFDRNRHVMVTMADNVEKAHLHADHVGDIPGLLGSLAKAGRVDPVEIWGGGSEDPAMGLAAFVDHMGKALAWDTASLRGVRPTTGCEAIAHEIPFDRPDTIYDRNGVTISSFPAIHGLSGAVGYAIAYAGRKVAFSGDTRPCRTWWRPQRVPTC